MPKRTNLKKILVIGAGPIVIGQACEFDYSGTQACKALKDEGFEVILINSNPATIMTDPELADRTYIEPITPEIVRQIIVREKPDAILPTMGGQTSLNVAVSLAEDGTLEKYKVELIGAKLNSIKLAEDRALFKQVVSDIGLNSAKSQTVTNFDEALKVSQEIGFPIILRPAFTLGGSGGGVAYDQDEFEKMVRSALRESPTSQVLLEEDLTGWKEYELEVVRDLADNVIIICSIENFDPMGVHTGDSITVAPAQTLSDYEYQNLRDQAIKLIRAIGVECGGSNIQFAVNPQNGKIIIIEMNPRVSRSSALASKATGYPIAKIAAKLSVGYTLDELPNEITKNTKAAFEPTIDYVVTKIPRFAFEKFVGAERILGTQMKSVGEAMSIGRTFCESFQKALRSLEKNIVGFGPFPLPKGLDKKSIENHLKKPSPDRVRQLWWAFDLGLNAEEISQITRIDLWFTKHLENIFGKYLYLKNNVKDIDKLSFEDWVEIKSLGFGDKQLADIFSVNEILVREKRDELSIKPVFKMVDTCSAEFESYTPYYYSTYETENEILKTKKDKVIIIGGGPNRIGQGIEFDYCCVHASMAIRETGFESIMINSNPETVSTDFDTSDRLYFEPITTEDVLEIWKQENPIGAIVQLGGQTPLNIAKEIEQCGVRILGTQVSQIERAENRYEFNKIVEKLGLKQPPSAIANKPEQVQELAAKVGYPVLVRPSHVLGGQSMQIVYNSKELNNWLESMSKSGIVWPVLIDKFLDDAIEVDVDAVSDTKETIVAGILEHIERAGIHSGDSSCVLPPHTLSEEQIDSLVEATKLLAKELQVVGLMNIQFALKNGSVYVIEVNPRASRTIPFVSKVTGIPWAKIGTKLMLGKTIEELKITGVLPEFSLKEFAKEKVVAVKEVVLPFKKFPGCQIALGPEMRSTGEVMGIDSQLGLAFAKGQISAGQNILWGRTVFLSVNDKDKGETLIEIAKTFEDLQFLIYCTEGTFKFLNDHGIKSTMVRKAKEKEPNILNFLTEKKISIIINIPKGNEAIQDNMSMRALAILMDLPLITTIAGAEATSQALQSLAKNRMEFSIKSLQEYQNQYQMQISKN
ncbi:MAG: carbamoyl-phosphate synthase large subunit [Candidatus Caenarcaniphilales bacterium]|nr:carbamoyl-phosphate synthase large subunit [Candidatus Caenarcaniphilales bacterium]